MFHSARFRLTFWYLVIIAFISFSFSGIIYRDVSAELERGFFAAEYRLRGLPVPLIPKQRARILLEEELLEAKRVVFFRLLATNGVILLVAGVGGYFLAGRTLIPIEEVMQKQKRFVADASHELRTPLTSMKVEMEVALRDKKMTAKKMRKVLASSLVEIDKMRDFTNSLLALSRYETNGKVLEVKRVDLVEICEEAIGANLAQAKRKRIEIKKDLQSIIVRGNEASLAELISILINNAIKYSPVKSRIDIQTVKKRFHGVIEVTDKGIGIDQKDIPHLFDRFFRADLARNKGGADGFGLGLSIAKSIVEAHRGEIKVNSVKDKGSSFKVILPL